MKNMKKILYLKSFMEAKLIATMTMTFYSDQTLGIYS